ncbi:APH(3') family aminoglycoside O-phosphotransferase [Paenibacillus mendelii]|uniref:APH(3') family aminoglycoside O-phosphotransferase n=1 Tax=Paenibacillus mendelii TaxID=206163 RepID=A0ABV6J9T7_9BACL|nr:APH(3') family aminoglycoside O-phosphotransferase [Paenibacillus mendelii]MCQ6563758.1 aminoglycoside 3'-phosphotransferase [Paenibacillus mendelii]
MKIDSFLIPNELSALIREGWEKIHAPYSGAATYRVEQVSGITGYLKILPVPHREPLEQYSQKLQWLETRLPVPAVLHYSKDERFEYLLMSEIEGIDGSDSVFKEDPAFIIRKLAEALKQVHAVEINDCPFDYTLSKRLDEIKHKIEAGSIDKKKLEEEFGDRFDNLYQWLIQSPYSSSEELVFTHGDYSVPNIIIRGKDISGLIDLADAGVADKYRDLAAMHYSIIRNHGEQWTGLLYEEYGISNVDLEKIRYYELLEAFSCYG